MGTNFSKIQPADRWAPQEQRQKVSVTLAGESQPQDLVGVRCGNTDFFYFPKAHASGASGNFYECLNSSGYKRGLKQVYLPRPAAGLPAPKDGSHAFYTAAHRNKTDLMDALGEGFAGFRAGTAAAPYSMFRDESGQSFFYTMRYMDGDGNRLRRGLRSYITDNYLSDANAALLRTAMAAFVTNSLARELQTLHAAGLIHNDIKPGNLVFSNNLVCLADFGGVSEIAGAGGGQYTEMYVAPEFLTQAQNESSTTPSFRSHPSVQTDIFSLGVTGAEFFAGEMLLIIPPEYCPEETPPAYYTTSYATYRTESNSEEYINNRINEFYVEKWERMNVRNKKLTDLFFQMMSPDGKDRPTLTDVIERTAEFTKLYNLAPVWDALEKHTPPGDISRRKRFSRLDKAITTAISNSQFKNLEYQSRPGEH